MKFFVTSEVTTSSVGNLVAAFAAAVCGAAVMWLVCGVTATVLLVLVLVVSGRCVFRGMRGH